MEWIKMLANSLKLFLSVACLLLAGCEEYFKTTAIDTSLNELTTYLKQSSEKNKHYSPEISKRYLQQYLVARHLAAHYQKIKESVNHVPFPEKALFSMHESSQITDFFANYAFPIRTWLKAIETHAETNESYIWRLSEAANTNEVLDRYSDHDTSEHAWMLCYFALLYQHTLFESLLQGVMHLALIAAHPDLKAYYVQDARLDLIKRLLAYSSLLVVIRQDLHTVLQKLFALKTAGKLSSLSEKILNNTVHLTAAQTPQDQFHTLLEQLTPDNQIKWVEAQKAFFKKNNVYSLLHYYNYSEQRIDSGINDLGLHEYLYGLHKEILEDYLDIRWNSGARVEPPGPATKLLTLLGNLTWGTINSVAGVGVIVVSAIGSPFLESVDFPSFSIAQNGYQIQASFGDKTNHDSVVFSLGLFVLSDGNGEFGPFIAKHEGGHAQQSAVLGPLYLPLILGSYAIQGSGDSFAEPWANSWGGR